MIYKFPVDINEIKNYFDKYKISESVKGGKGFFKVL
jgi:hypothetical protein